MINYFLVFLLFAVGIYGVLVKKNMVKKILGLAIFTYAVNLLWVLVGYKRDGIPPIISKGDLIDKSSLIIKPEVIAGVVDPMPQAIVLTAIVIDLAVLALAVGIALRIYDKTGTFDVTEIKKLKG